MKSDNEWKNKLFFGDNLIYLKQLHKDYPKGFIDLVYIDPPFNSKRNYNVLFESIELTDSKAQKEAFSDTWSNISYIDTLKELGDLHISSYEFLSNLEHIGVSRSIVSYLSIMAIRIYYIQKLLKDTGSFYLHCDPTMSHYLKIICDLIFAPQNYNNEITWKRSSAHNDSKQGRKAFGNITDTIFFYSKSSNYVFNTQYIPYSKDYIEAFYVHKDDVGRKFRLDNLTAAKGGGDTSYDFYGTKPYKGRFWAYSREKMENFKNEGRLYFPKNGGTPAYKRYLDEMPGVAAQNVWDDLGAISSQSSERLGYPTQKPEALLERIINTSTNEGDLVADFFCGCGTSIAVAEKLNRKWIGVDISHLAVKLIADRVGRDKVDKTFEIHGFPKDIDSAKELANNVKGGRLEFEQWIVEVLLSGVLNDNRTQMGFDGYRTFDDGKTKHRVFIEVKSGGVTMAQFNHFIHIVKDHKASMGIFVCFAEQVTKNMKLYAKKEGDFKINDYSFADKIQIATVEDLLDNRMPNIPTSREETFKKADQTKTITVEKADLFSQPEG